MSQKSKEKPRPSLPAMPEFDEWTNRLLGDPFDPQKYGEYNPKHYEDFTGLVEKAALKPKKADQT